MLRCEYCGQVYQREAAFMRHTCEAMERARTMSTPIGQSAFMLYQKWWKMKKRMAPGADRFRDSTHFRAMVEFAEFAKRTKLNIDAYMQMLIRHDLTPEHWLRDDVYSKYLEYLDKTMPPADQIKMCADFVMKLADVLECDTSEVLNDLQPVEMMQLVRDRKLSPWLLLHSKAFKVWLINQDGPDQQQMQGLIHPVYWRMRFEKDPESAKKAKQVALALGL